MSGPFYSQTGEDILLAGIFEGQQRGTCLEVGALDGVKDSITLHFEEKGWSCILVEANPELAEKAKANRRARVFSCAAGRTSGMTEFVIAKGAEYLSTMNPTHQHISRILNDGGSIEKVQVPVMRVDDILEMAQVSRLDFATIDVEGAELGVLQGFDLQRWQPKVLVVEENDCEVRRYLRIKGYCCFLHEGLNDWYARKGDKSLLTPRRLFAEHRRQVRRRLFKWTVGLLPAELQLKLVRWKRRWLKKL